MSEPLGKNLWERLNNSALVRFLLLFACGWAAVEILEYFETVIVIFTFAAIVAFLLSYPVRSLHRFVPHGVAVTVVFIFGMTLIVGLTVTVGISVVSQGQQLIESLTTFFNSMLPLLERLENYLRQRNIQVNLNLIEEQFREQLLAGLGIGLGYSLATIQIFFANFLNLILIAVVSFFMLLDGDRLWNLLIKFVPNHLQNRVTLVIKRKFLGFFRGQLLLSLFLTTSSFIVFLVLNVPFALLLAIITGLFDLIPGIGATLGVGIVFIILLSQNVWLAIQVVAACIVLQQLQDNLISPRIMQNSLNINPVVVFFALLVGARVAGLLGIFISIPITGVIVSLFEIDEMKAEV
ncbi:AI-2E family transporter [Trichocoleus sp. FACHB-90]|jgi:predicted PurR-regulated permease PerM|uniref:AI-2E family transporter n=1 Tax=Cyanophyceae TaxID=3028117 RepID=UPI0016872F35|nr:AI-2E family transporter [Trichocoleus sp. FACHB-90]MBD1927756.1 AI-2E family transporter [Trichocoleus sp. FACHB-90]